MSKLAKSSLITAVCILITGIAVYTVGMIGGGREDVRKMEENGDLDFFKDHLKVRMFHGLNLAWWTDSPFTWGDNDIDIDLSRNDGSATHSTHHSSGLASEETIDASTVTELDIELGGGYLYIDQDTTSDSQGNIRVIVDAQDDAGISYYVKNGTLHIEGFQSKKWNVLSDSHENYIYVILPGDFAFQKSEIELGAGYIEMNGGEYGKTDIDIGAGEIICNNIKTGKMEAEVGAGNFEASDIEADEINVSAAMGQVMISDGTISGNIELSCDMGNLYLEMQGKEEEFNYEIECSMGSITIDGYDYSGFGKEKYIDNRAAKEIKAECSMGNIEVVFSE